MLHALIHQMHYSLESGPITYNRLARYDDNLQTFSLGQAHPGDDIVGETIVCGPGQPASWHCMAHFTTSKWRAGDTGCVLMVKVPGSKACYAQTFLQS